MRLRKLEILFIIIMLLPLSALTYKYYVTDSVKEQITAQVNYLEETVDYKFGGCPEGQVRIDLKGGVHSPRSYICREEVDRSLWVNIYDGYPKSVRGQENVYRFMDKGSLEIAEQYLDGYYAVPRFDPVQLENITWEEDPYNERYWRFIFYSLRETNHLVFASEKTGQQDYSAKLVEIIESFVDKGMDKEYSWDDYHGVSFRTLSLINAWWKLREQNALPVEVSTKILQALVVHGDFLMQPEHFESEHNHGITEAVALLVLGTNFPDLPGSETWVDTGVERLNMLVNNLIDDDGVLVENTPYYHLYSLEKLWEIYHYAQLNGVELTDNFNNKLLMMIDYTQYILQPNLHVPLMGASLEIGINLNGEYREMAEIDPELLYVLTKGEKGEAPELLNIYYPTAGQTIMRSGWGKGKNFTNQTQLVYDIGPYRTAHSDLDGLSFTLYSNGLNLVTDSGIYTYEPGEYRDYFHGTAAHNTVLVNDSDQFAGSPAADQFLEGEGYAIQTAHHNLYPDVTHYRGMVLLGHDYVLIVDRLISEEPQNYKQLFHLFPGAKLETNELTVRGIGSVPEQQIAIHQLVPEGIELSTILDQKSPPNGMCSFVYEESVPCYAIVYEQNTEIASYITLLEIGDQSEQPFAAEVSSDMSAIHLRTHEGDYNITLNMPTSGGVNMKVVEETVTTYNLNLVFDGDEWELESADGSDTTFDLTSTDEGNLAIEGPDDTDFDVRIAGVGTFTSIGDTAATDIPTRPGDNFVVYEQEDYVPIFAYRYLVEDFMVAEDDRFIHLSDFEEQVEYATEVMGCKWYTFADIMENYVIPNIKTPRNACVMTFDGGHKSNYELASPVLDNYQIKASFYVVPSRVGSDDQFMTWGHLQELYVEGHEIGVQALEAGSLVREEKTTAELVYQISEAKNVTEDRGFVVKTFAYPYGDWNDEIVQIVKESGYIAARDADKPNSWRDRRPMVASLDTDVIWHMTYHTPNTNTPEEVGQILGYNSWWQFEENFRIGTDQDSDIDVTSAAPTTTSYASVELGDTGDSITNEFLVSESGSYTITVYATTGYVDMNEPHRLLSRMKIQVDGIRHSLTPGNTENCTSLSKWIFCEVQVTADLTPGKHTLMVESIDGRLKFDKFNVFLTVPLQEAYRVVVTEHKKSGAAPEENSDAIRLQIDASLNKPPFQFSISYVYLGLGIFVVGMLLRFLKYRRDLIAK